MITKLSLFLFLFVAFSAKNRKKGTLRFKSTKLVSKNILQLVEELLEPRDAMKMNMIDEQWSKVIVTGNLNLFPNQSSIKVWCNVENHVVFWDDAEQLLATLTRERISMCLQKTNFVEISSCLFDAILVRMDYLQPNTFFKVMMDFIAENLDMSKKELRALSHKKPNGLLPFLQVACYDSLKLLSKLIQIDPRIVNTADLYLYTALHVATSASCSKFLLQHGANVDAKSLCGSTPLHLASFRGDDEIVEALLGHNANTKIVSRRDDRSGTALDFARQMNHQRCVDLIEAHEKQLNLLTTIKNFLLETRPTDFLPDMDILVMFLILPVFSIICLILYHH